MSFEVKILADSIASGVRLVTVQATYPRIIHSEVMTHRVLSRNAASSRAIPIERSIERVLADPFVPEAFAANQRGMQAGDAFIGDQQDGARAIWNVAMERAVTAARAMAVLGVHKHWANRLLEPYSWITTIFTATEWENFFALRCHKDAAPEFQKIAGMMREAMAASAPRECKPYDYHLPFVAPFGGDLAACRDLLVAGHIPSMVDALVQISVARCARVSYLTHEGKRDVAADLVLYNKLVNASPRHLSPCEHAARVATEEDWERFDARFAGNFRMPWVQHRKDIEGEAVFRG
jgi:thymidylate synthase ThyX